MSNALPVPARHIRVALTLALTLALTVLVVAACGGSSDSGSDGVASLDGAAGAETGPTTTLSAADIEEQYLVWADCMAGEGLDVPELTVDAEGNPSLAPRAGAADDAEGQGPRVVDREEMTAATEVCGEIPGGLIGGGGGGPANNEEFQDAALEFAQCMRDNGVDVPDPDFSAQPPADGEAPEVGGGGGGGGGIFGGAVDQDDPTVQAAMEACQDLLGDLGRGPGATTTAAP